MVKPTFILKESSSQRGDLQAIFPLQQCKDSVTTGKALRLPFWN
jgi:hypothetical protein